LTDRLLSREQVWKIAAIVQQHNHAGPLNRGQAAKRDSGFQEINGEPESKISEHEPLEKITFAMRLSTQARNSAAGASKWIASKPEQRVVVALGERMAVDDLNQHDAETTRPLQQLFLRNTSRGLAAGGSRSADRRLRRKM
jgi:hypothetical protein